MDDLNGMKIGNPLLWEWEWEWEMERLKWRCFYKCSQWKTFTAIQIHSWNSWHENSTTLDESELKNEPFSSTKCHCTCKLFRNQLEVIFLKNKNKKCWNYSFILMIQSMRNTSECDSMMLTNNRNQWVVECVSHYRLHSETKSGY